MSEPTMPHVLIYGTHQLLLQVNEVAANPKSKPKVMQHHGLPALDHRT